MVATRLRLAMLLALLALTAIIVLGASCRTPTQIVVEVRSNACPDLQSTNIAVATTEAELEAKAEPKAAKTGCDSSSMIGSLVLVPEGDEEREVILRVITGVTTRADDCARSGNDGCIVAKRRVRFVPDEIVRLTIDMNRVCLGKNCGAESSCDEQTGECVAIPCVGPTCRDVEGGAPVDGAADRNVVDTGAVDAKPDGPPQPVECTAANCGGPGKSCQVGICVVQCGPGGAACTGLVCPAGVPCVIRCMSGCDKVACGKATFCTVECLGAQSCKNGIDCGEASTCIVQCKANQACSGDIACSTKPGAGCDVDCGGGGGGGPDGKGCTGKVYCCTSSPCKIEPPGVDKTNECR